MTLEKMGRCKVPWLHGKKASWLVGRVGVGGEEEKGLKVDVSVCAFCLLRL